MAALIAMPVVAFALLMSMAVYEDRILPRVRSPEDASVRPADGAAEQPAGDAAGEPVAGPAPEAAVRTGAVRRAYGGPLRHRGRHCRVREPVPRRHPRPHRQPRFNPDLVVERAERAS